MHQLPRILKNAAPIPAARIPAAVRDADLRVRDLIAAAETRAAAIVAAATAAGARITAEAEEGGHRAGLARAAAILASAAAARDARLRAAERELAMLSLDVARAVLGRELSVRGDAVVDLAARALAEARERHEVTLRVHPEDAAAVRSAEGPLAALLARAPLAIREDAALPRGGAIVETEAGGIDACVETQLAALARALREDLP